FAISAVKDQHALARLEAENRREIMRLGAFQRQRGTGPERLVDVESGAAEVITRHGCLRDRTATLPEWGVVRQFWRWIAEFGEFLIRVCSGSQRGPGKGRFGQGTGDECRNAPRPIADHHRADFCRHSGGSADGTDWSGTGRPRRGGAVAWKSAALR